MTIRLLPLLLWACGPVATGPASDTPADPVDTGEGDTATSEPVGDDDDDVTTDPAACIDGVLGLAPVTDSTVAAEHDVGGSCGGNGGADLMWSFRAPEAGLWRFALSDTTFDTVLYLLDACDGAERTCANTREPETVATALAQDEEIVVVVDSNSSSQGAFTLTATLAPGDEGVCDDGLDDDDDGLTDCLDPDCATTPQCAEICDDGIDNNGTGLVDCLDRANCDADPACASDCADDELAGPLPISLFDTTAGGVDDHTPTCSNSFASDRAYAFIAPADGSYTFDTVGSSYDTVIAVFDGCGGRELACNDDMDNVDRVSSLTGPLVEGQRVIVVVDGYLKNDGDVRVNVW